MSHYVPTWPTPWPPPKGIPPYSGDPGSYGYDPWG